LPGGLPDDYQWRQTRARWRRSLSPKHPQLATRKAFEEQPIVTTTYKVAFGDNLRLPGRGQRHQVAK